MRVSPPRMIATTGDHPLSLRDRPRQRGQNGTVATRQPFGPCNWGRPSAAAHLRACRIAFVYKQLCRLLSPPQSDGGCYRRRTAMFLAFGRFSVHCAGM